MKRIFAIAALAIILPVSAFSQDVPPQRQIDQLNALARILKGQRDEAMDRAAVLASTVELLQGDIKRMQEQATAAARALAVPSPLPPPPAPMPVAPPEATYPPEEE